MSDESVILEQKGSALWATINREESRNALNVEVFDRLAETVRIAERDLTVRSIVWTGVGSKAFCSGADLKPQKGLHVFDPAEPTTVPVEFTRIIQRSRVPIIGRINGHAVAGGVGLTAMCDFAVGVKGSRFALPEITIGIFPMQIFPALREVIPHRLLTEMALTGRAISAELAAEVGLLSYAVEADELDAKVQFLIDAVEAASPTGIRRGKFAMRAMADMSMEQALSYSESNIAVTVQTEDAAEARVARREKRKPVWTGR